MKGSGILRHDIAVGKKVAKTKTASFVVQEITDEVYEKKEFLLDEDVNSVVENLTSDPQIPINLMDFEDYFISSTNKIDALKEFLKITENKISLEDFSKLILNVEDEIQRISLIDMFIASGKSAELTNDAVNKMLTTANIEISKKYLNKLFLLRSIASFTSSQANHLLFKAKASKLSLEIDDNTKIIIWKNFFNNLGDKISCQTFAELLGSLHMHYEAKKMDLIIEFFASDKVDLSTLNAKEFIASLELTDDVFKNNLEILGDICLKKISDKYRVKITIQNFIAALGIGGPLINNKSIRTNLIINFIQQSSQIISYQGLYDYLIKQVTITQNEAQNIEHHFFFDEQKEKISKTWRDSRRKLLMQKERLIQEEESGKNVQQNSQLDEQPNKEINDIVRQQYAGKLSMTQAGLNRQEEQNENTKLKTNLDEQLSSNSFKTVVNIIQPNNPMALKLFNFYMSRGLKGNPNFGDDDKIKIWHNFFKKINIKIPCVDFEKAVKSLDIKDEANKMDLIIEFFASDKVDLSTLNAKEFIASLELKDDSFKKNLEILGDICFVNDIKILFQVLNFEDPLLGNEGMRTNLIINFIQKSQKPINQSDYERFKIFIKDEEKLDRITKVWQGSQKPLIQSPRHKTSNETLQTEKSIQVSDLLGSVKPSFTTLQSSLVCLEPMASTQVISSVSINEVLINQTSTSHRNSTRRSFNSCCSIS